MEAAATAATAVIALVALVVSIWVARQQTRIQERVAAIEEARRAEELAARERAQVTASVRREDGLRLVLHNEGPAVARGVRMAVEDSPQTPGLIGLEALPVDLQPHQEMKFIVAVGLGDQQILRVVVRWADAAGEHKVPYALLMY